VPVTINFIHCTMDTTPTSIATMTGAKDLNAVVTTSITSEFVLSDPAKCPMPTYTIEPATSWLTYDSASKEIWLDQNAMSAANPADGTVTFQLQGTLYGEVKTVPFIVEIVATIPCIVTQFEVTPSAASLVYTLGSGVVNHDMSAVFQLAPACVEPSFSFINASDIPYAVLDPTTKNFVIQTNDKRYQGSTKEAIVRATFGGENVDYRLTIDIPCTDYVMSPSTLYSMQTSAMGEPVEQELPSIDSGPYCSLTPVLVNLNGGAVGSFTTLDVATGSIRVESTLSADARAAPYSYRLDYFFDATLKVSVDLEVTISDCVIKQVNTLVIDVLFYTIGDALLSYDASGSFEQVPNCGHAITMEYTGDLHDGTIYSQDANSFEVWTDQPQDQYKGTRITATAFIENYNLPVVNLIKVEILP